MRKFLFIAAALVALIFGTVANAQTQINQSNVGSFPYNITQPGSYILTSNLTVTAANTTAIMISTSNVTLNLNGYTISGPQQCTSSSCVYSWTSFGVEGQGNNISIFNGNISGFYAGASTWSGRIEDLNIYSCQYGISASYATVKHNSISKAPSIAIYGQSSSIVENQVASSGIAYEGYNSSFVANTAYSNLSYGIYMNGGTASGNTLISNSTDLYNAYNGITNKTNSCTSGAC